MLARLAACVLAAILIFAARPGQAQQVDRIAAVVNDEIISNRDLEQRTEMALALSHLPDTLETRRRVVPQVLRKMIDEQLQMQEAKRLKISLTKKEVDNGIAMIERQNGMPPGGMARQLAAAGVEMQLVRQQITADLTWMRVAASELQRNIHISDEEINDRLEIIKEQRGKPEFLLDEIFLPVDKPAQDEQMHTLGDRLIQQLRQGAPFPVLANQFSQSPTAANGGSLGWVSDGMIDDRLFKAISTLPPGQITPLLRISDGYHILGLVRRRIAGSGGIDPNATVTLAQLVLPLPASGGPSKDALVARAMQITQGAPSCDAFEEVGRKVGATKVGQVGPVKLNQLPPAVHEAVAQLAEGQVSAPLIAPDGLQVLMMCTRSSLGMMPLPTRDVIRNEIENERLDMLTQRYLRDLRRAAFIDIRM